MTLTARWVTIVLTPLALVSLLFAAFPSFATDIGFDFWNLSELERQIEECSRSSERYTRETKQADKRSALRRDITNQLIRGERDFASAATFFYELNNEDDKLALRTQLIYRADNLRASSALQVFSYAKYSPEKISPERLAQLEKDCQAYLSELKQK
jgi:hypothetical protein